MTTHPQPPATAPAAFAALASAFLAAGLAWAGPDDDLPAYRFKMDDPRPSKAARAQAADFLSQPDWGVLIDGPDGQLGVAEVDESTNEGEGYFDLPAGTKPQVCLVDVDLQAHDVLTERMDLPLQGGPHQLQFPDGSTVELTVAAFDAEGASGADAKPVGARPLALGKLDRDTLNYAGGDRTDFWALEVPAAGWIEGFVCHPNGLLTIQWRTGNDSGAVEDSQGNRIRAEVSAGKRLLRLRSKAWGAWESPYALFFAPVREDGKGREALVRALLELATDERFGCDGVEEDLLEELGGDAAEAAWIAGLDHPSAAARGLAIRGVQIRRVRSAVAKLAQLAKSDPDEVVREQAAEALERLRE